MPINHAMVVLQMTLSTGAGESVIFGVRVRSMFALYVRRCAERIVGLGGRLIVVYARRAEISETTKSYATSSRGITL